MACFYDKISDTIERRAINSSGRLGSFYDATRDQIVQPSSTFFPIQCSPLNEQPRCILIKGKTDEGDNLLRTIGIENELRLSLLMNLTKRDGIARILNHHDQIDKKTRFLYYSWVSHEITLKTVYNDPEIIESCALRSTATHIITGIRYGIDFLVVMKMQPGADIIEIDSILQIIRKIFLDTNHSLSYTMLEKINHLDNVVDITVYSNVPLLTVSNKILHLLLFTQTLKWSFELYYPLTYLLRTVISPCLPNIRTIVRFRTLSSLLLDYIESRIVQFRSLFRCTASILLEILSTVLCNHHRHLWHTMLAQFRSVKYDYIEKRKYLVKLIMGTRTGQMSDSEIWQILDDHSQFIWLDGIKNLIRSIERIIRTNSPVVDMKELQFYDWDTEACSSYMNENITVSKNRFDDDNPAIDFTSVSRISDTKDQMNLPKEKNGILSSSQVNLNASSCQVNKNDLSSADEISPKRLQSKHELVCSEISIPTSTSTLSNDDFTNILLMGETGVGKSTFINAFANYIAFNSLEQAQENEPIVIIPVSFIITNGDNFEETTIKFGEIDSLNNENFNNSGQSVTQHCKSYVFKVKKSKKKLRIIDTPGFGDTRGLKQDDQNMEHILHYINNLTHLNAICFLLKPNSQRLNIYFRTCLSELFSFLNPDARKNIIFCFTNGRSTFYTPGDTAPLLKKMLTSISITDVPFEKDNTFCFDSEAFRYLVALRNGISFSNNDKHEYEKSWSISVKESERFIHYIDQQATVDLTKSGWQSVKHLQFQISYMIRPLLETMRNILRNLIVCESNQSIQFIGLRAKAVHHKATHCLFCKDSPELIGDFLILPFPIHDTQDTCRICSCSPDQHIPVDYTLEFCTTPATSDFHKDALKQTLELLRNASFGFVRFLTNTKNDPFITGLTKMIAEETSIYETKTPADYNRQLIQKLKDLKKQYDELKSQVKSDHEAQPLADIYKTIKIVNEYPMMHQQMKAVKQTQQKMMEQFEYEPQQI